MLLDNKNRTIDSIWFVRGTVSSHCKRGQRSTKNEQSSWMHQSATLLIFDIQPTKSICSIERGHVSINDKPIMVNNWIFDENRNNPISWLIEKCGSWITKWVSCVKGIIWLIFIIDRSLLSISFSIWVSFVTFEKWIITSTGIQSIPIVKWEAELIIAS